MHANCKLRSARPKQQEIVFEGEYRKAKFRRISVEIPKDWKLIVKAEKENAERPKL